MKRLFFIMLIATALAACGKDESERVTNKEPEIILENQNDNTVIKENINDKKEEATSNESSTLEDLVKHFENNGFTIGEKTFKAFELVGAVDGFGIELNGANVEVYLYAPDSPDLVSIKTNGEYDMDGFVFPAVANGNVVLIAHDDHPEEEKIVEVFNNF